MWVNVRSLVREPANPYYATENMEEVGRGTARRLRRYPNMRVYDWASDVKDAWFIEDGIHFTSPGYAARAAADRPGPGPRLPRQGGDAKAAPRLRRQLSGGGFRASRTG